MVRIFGPLIEKLRIHHFHMNKKQRNAIHRVLSKYCSDTLKSISFDNLGKNDLGVLTPMKKVEIVIADQNFVETNGEFKITQVFPALRRLELSYFSEFDGNLLDVEIPTLAEVEIRYTHDKDFASNFKKCLMKNPQIRHLTLEWYNSIHSLELACDYLPNLEELEIPLVYHDYTLNPIHFPNVKKFTTEMGQLNYFDIITFGRLEELKLTCRSDECPNFMDRNPNLNKLTLKTKSITDEYISRVGHKLLNLTELSIAIVLEDSVIDTDTIIQLMNERKNLNRIKLSNFGNGLFEALERHFSEIYNVREEHSRDIYIEKQ